MESTKTLTPDNLLLELLKWKLSHPTAVQLDGSNKGKSNRNIFCYVSFNNNTYRLHMDTKATAVKRFFDLSKRLGNPREALCVGVSREGLPCLRINDGKDKANGWFCYSVAQTQSKSKKQAA